MMVNKSYPGTATHFKTSDTQIASVDIPPKLQIVDGTETA